MWRDFLAELGLDLREPAQEAQIAAAERALEATWPEELRALLLETNGVFDEYGGPIVRPAADIVVATRDMWRLDADQLYMPFAPHVYFGQEANGDAYFFRVLGSRADTDVFAWLHEDDSRSNYAHNLRVYVKSRGEEAREQFDPDLDNATLDALLDCLAFLALSGNDAVHPDAAVRQMQSIASALQAAPEDQRRAFAARAQGLAFKEQDPVRADFLRSVGADLGLFSDADS